jgi:gamma-glutamyltranspeptidase/glutathione hydrolase
MQNFNWTNPYPTVRIPLFARNVVSTSHPLAAQAGLRMLLKGGNAVDAAIAAAAAITLVEPVSCGLGSDAFAILWDGKQLHGLNSSGVAPAAWNPTTSRTSTAPTATALRTGRSVAGIRSPCLVSSPAGPRCTNASASCRSKT